jgi:SAM-dependent methyltransferase
MVSRILAASPGTDVLDVGCGTGIVARQFQAAGCKVLGVDVDARMAALAREAGLEVEVSRFEAWDPRGRTFDALLAGQAWHWVDSVAGAARAADALRPGGRLAVFWNVQQPPPDLAQAFSAVYQRVLPDVPLYRPGVEAYAAILANAADGIAQVGAFAGPEQWRFEWQQPYTREQWLDVVPTAGGHSLFAPAKLAELLAGIGAAIDAVGGSFVMSYTAVVVTAARAASEARAPSAHNL